MANPLVGRLTINRHDISDFIQPTPIASRRILARGLWLPYMMSPAVDEL